MIKAVLILAQLSSVSVCTKTQPIDAGTVATCSGILWPVEATRKAITCKTIEIPKLKADHALEIATCNADRDAFKVRALSAEAIIETAPKPAARWILPTTAAAGVVVGVVLGVLTATTL